MEIGGEDQGEDVGQYQHDGLRDDGEDDGVLQRRAEGGVGERGLKVPQPHEVDALVPDGDVADAVEDSQHQRDADQGDDVDDSREEQQRPQHAFPVEPVATVANLRQGGRRQPGPARSRRSPIAVETQTGLRVKPFQIAAAHGEVGRPADCLL